MAINKKWTKVSVFGSFEAVHSWKAAPQSEWFLRNEHRHLFEVEVRMEVFHLDREIEFLALKKQLDKILQSLPKVSTRSCEMFADEIALKLNKKYKNRGLWISVREDGKEGSISGYDLN